MAKSNREYVFEGMELLPSHLIPFVEERLETSLGIGWQNKVQEKVHDIRINHNGEVDWDQQRLLYAMERNWHAFHPLLGKAERAVVNELIDVRNRLSHYAKFSDEDAERALDSMRRLMKAVNSQKAAEQLKQLRYSVLRREFPDLGHTDQRKPKNTEPRPRPERFKPPKGEVVIEGPPRGPKETHLRLLKKRLLKNPSFRGS